MPRSHGKQKQQEKRKKKRQIARRRDHERAAALTLPAREARLIQRASSVPHGPSFISPEWRDANEDMPGLVSIVVTRCAPSGLLVPGVALVDRTCLGVKQGFVGAPVIPLDLPDFVEKIGEAHNGIERCDLLVAQSVLYHALDFARSLGFAPHRDFPEPLFGPRPEPLLDTPLARPSRPIYASGPNDDVPEVIRQLNRVVGSAFSFSLGGLGGLIGADEPWLDDDEEYDDEEDEVDDFGSQEEEAVTPEAPEPA
jgi:hypothetical protein